MVLNGQIVKENSSNNHHFHPVLETLRLKIVQLRKNKVYHRNVRSNEEMKKKIKS